MSHWADQIRAGDMRAISRAISAIENRDPAAVNLLQEIFPHTGRACLLGVTGGPGTGKSTLVNRLAAQYRQQNKQVGIIAIDPSSPYTGGAILGDRIRMQGHSSDPGIFIRSMATRGFLGGLSRATGDAALVLDASDKQYIIVETVGVGQDEVDVIGIADCTIVVLVPGLGDDIQNMKAGLMEIADIFVLNKSDREGADRLEQQVAAMLEIAPDRASNRDAWKPRIVRTVATEGQGVDELAATIEAYREFVDQAADRQSKRQEYWKRRLITLAQEKLLENVLAGSGENMLHQLALQVSAREKDPYTAVNEFIANADWRTKNP